jgi:hypothetical protein
MPRSAATKRSGRRPPRARRGRAGPARKSAGRAGRRWSQRVTETSDALDLEPGVFTFDDPAEVARSLRRSAERSRRRKADPYRSAMSMLVFYINRAGRNLPKRRKKVLEKAKDELRALYDRPRRAGRKSEEA